jgi:hypothetical protein
MDAASMPRKNRTFRLDERLIDGLAEVARNQNTSANKIIENWLLKLCKDEGILPPDAKPLGETRGGDRVQAEALEQ